MVTNMSGQRKEGKSTRGRRPHRKLVCGVKDHGRHPSTISAMRAFVLFVEHGPPGRGLSIGQVPVENSKSTGNLPGKLLWGPGTRAA
jgi:hypothetical protein